MSAELLREAASEIRDDMCGRKGGAWQPVVRFHLAVADWLDSAASGFVDDEPIVDAAIDVARAYLGRES